MELEQRRTQLITHYKSFARDRIVAAMLDAFFKTATEETSLMRQ